MCFLHFRKEDGLRVIFISEISKKGKPTEKGFWPFNLLESLIKEKDLHLLRFNLLDIQVDYIGIRLYWVLETEIISKYL